MDLSVIIVEYRNTDLLKKACSSIGRAIKGLKTEIIVVSNTGYPDSEQIDLRKSLPEVHFVFNIDNIGFARAVNQGIRESAGLYVLLLNPDAELLDNGISEALQFMQRKKEVATVGPMIIDHEGNVQDSARSFMTPGKLAYRIWRRFLGAAKSGILDKMDYTRAQPVDWISGACMLIRRGAIEEVGQLDGRYFMYAEDMDWCRRSWLKGREVWYLPEWTIEHNACRASSSCFSIGNRLMWIHINSLYKYFVKWHFKSLPLQHHALTTRKHTDKKIVLKPTIPQGSLRS